MCFHLAFTPPSIIALASVRFSGLFLYLPLSVRSTISETRLSTAAVFPSMYFVFVWNVRFRFSCLLRQFAPQIPALRPTLSNPLLGFSRYVAYPSSSCSSLFCVSTFLEFSLNGNLRGLTLTRGVLASYTGCGLVYFIASSVCRWFEWHYLGPLFRILWCLWYPSVVSSCDLHVQLFRVV